MHFLQYSQINKTEDMQTQIRFRSQFFPGNDKKRQHFNGFYCGCGTTLENKDQYKEHVSSDHQGLFVEGSSHFISIYSQIVLPCRCWDPSMISSTQLTVTQTQNPTQVNDTQKLVSPVPNNQQFNKIGLRTRKIQRTNKREASFDQHEKQTNSILIKTNNPSHQIEWNGFVLLPNIERDHCLFFCGACRLQFSSPEEFVTHCFDICQQLEHLDSSHFITLPDNESSGQKQTPDVIESPRKKRGPGRPRISQLRSNLLTGNEYPENRGSSRARWGKGPSVYRAGDIPEMKSIIRLFKNRAINKQQRIKNKEVFICGCGYRQDMAKVNPRTYIHVIKSHQDVLPNNSSHIFVRWQKLTEPIRICSADDQEVGWSCPCKPGVNMTCKMFVKHVLYVHKGISHDYRQALSHRDQ